MTDTTYNVLKPENGALIKAWTKGVQLEDAARQQLTRRYSSVDGWVSMTVVTDARAKEEARSFTQES
jgi:hypothetical protein